MKETVHSNIHMPYSLHDMRITSMAAEQDKLTLLPQSGILKTEGVDEQIDGFVRFEGVQWDFSYAYVLECCGNQGKFSGEKNAPDGFYHSVSSGRSDRFG